MRQRQVCSFAGVLTCWRAHLLVCSFAGVLADTADELKAQKRGNRKLRQTNGMLFDAPAYLVNASTYFAG